MSFQDLLAELRGIVSGDPEYLTSNDPSALREQAISTIGSILVQCGLKPVSRAQTQRTPSVDLVLSLDGQLLGFELKFGRVSASDVQRYRFFAQSSSFTLQQVLIICSEPDEGLEQDTRDQSGPPVRVMSFDQFLEVLGMETGEGPQLIADYLRSVSRVWTPRAITEAWLGDVRDYVVRTFGQEFFDTVSKDETSLSVFKHNRDLLGQGQATILLAGTTNTGKSTIANVMFGERIVDTAPWTDTTGEIARIRLPSGLVIIDTPGVGGLDDKFENITRAYIGLSQNPELKTVSDIPIADLTNPDQPVKEVTRGSIPISEEVISLVVFDVVGGLKRADLEFFREIKAHFPRTLLVGNKSDLLSSEDLSSVSDNVRRRIGDSFAAIAAKPRNRGHPGGIEDLVRSICRLMSERAITSFNSDLVSLYQRRREEIVRGAIVRTAAKASTIRSYETLPGNSIPVYQALLLGLVLKLGVDFEIGGASTKQEILDATTELFTQVSRQRRQRDVHLKDTPVSVPRWVDQTTQGAVAGAGTGALIGIIGGPIGMFLGAILGGLVGSALGSSSRVKQLVRQIWTVPVENIRDLPGGADAALATAAFGFALRDSFVQIEARGGRPFDESMFETLIGTYYRSMRSSLKGDQIQALDSADEQRAYDVMSTLRVP